VKKLTMATVLAAAAMIAGSMTTFAQDHDSHYKDLYEPKLLHEAFHKAVSHAGLNAATKAQQLAEILALWTDDGVLITRVSPTAARANRHGELRARADDVVRPLRECRRSMGGDRGLLL